MQASDRLIVAADFSTRDEILRLADDLRGVAGVIKLGLQAFVANGPGLVREVTSGGHRVFLDLKLHDIPNTVSHAAAEAAKLGVAMLTVHATGGAEHGLAAAQPLLVLGVTVLTSLSDRDVEEIGLTGTASSNAVRLARLAQRCGLGGVVASPLEIAAIRDACGAELAIVTPGIRPAGEDRGDQQRTMTPLEAVRAGADYIVVGRPITGARNPRHAAMKIVEDMKKAG
jgi:orotidine-5'-phosphate decarboxylase